MKYVTMLAVAFALSSTSVFASGDTKFTVLGNCGMCKNRIEKAAKAAGASKAIWDAETQTLTVSFKAKKTSLDKIQQEVAAVGHDTEKYKAPDEVYNNLHGCCKYNRNGGPKAEKH